MANKGHKGNQKARAVLERPDKSGKVQRQVDPTKVVAVIILTIVLLMSLWVFNPEHFTGVMIAFLAGTIYGIALPHMAQRIIH